MFESLNPAANTPAAISLAAFLLTFDNKIDQPQVFGFLTLSVAPGIIAAARNLKHLAHGHYAVLAPNRSMTLYFNFTSFQLRIENFATNPLAFVV